MVLSFQSVDKILKCDNSNEVIEQHFPVVPFIVLYNVVLTSFQDVH